MGILPSAAGRGLAALRETFERVSIRGVLFVGFSLILALFVVSGVDLVRRVSDVEQRTADVHHRYMVTEEQLLTIRTQILLGSVYLRDALLDTPDQAASYRSRLQRARSAVDQALVTYVPIVDSLGEREGFARLRSEIADFWNTVLPALSWDTERRATQARALLRERVIPKREVIVRISERVQELNRAAFLEQQAAVRSIYQGMRRQIWRTSLAVLVLAAGIALFVTGYAGRLERRIQQQRLRELENRRSLQRLSAKLVGAQEEERRTIARELHDEIGQALTALKMELAIVERTLEPDARADNTLGEVRSITDRLLHTVRDLSQLLHPPLLDDLGLPATIEWYLRGFSKRTGVAADLVQDGMNERLAPGVEICLFRIAQEALTNVARHAEATRVRVYLQRLPLTVLLTVEDNGVGFDADVVMAPATRRGLGLLGIQERVAGFGGQFRVETAKGKGSRLTAELPALEDEARRAPGGDEGVASSALEVH